MHQLVIRPNQYINSFGPGSIIDFPNLSLMPKSIKYWNFNKSIQIIEPRLQKHLRTWGLYTLPRTSSGYTASNDIPATIFPKFVVCPKCKKIGHYKYLASNVGSKHYKGLWCRACNIPLHPARFIVTCENGHIDDFPWAWWVHNGETDCPGLNMEIFSLGIKSGLEDIWVKCSCGAKRNLMGIFSSENLIDCRCTGRKPWFEEISRKPKIPSWEVESSCESRIRVLQRGASNIYFPIIHSALSIPFKEGLIEKVGSIPEFNNEEVIECLEKNNISSLKMLINVIKQNREIICDVETDELLDAIKAFHELTKKPMLSDEKIKKDIRKEEWKILIKDKDVFNEENQFDKTIGGIDEEIKEFIEGLYLINRIREVRVLLGFSRLDPFEINNRIYFINEEPRRRLPAVEVIGEGIFLKLNSNRLKKWKTNYTKSERYKILYDNYNKQKDDLGFEREITPELIITHSLAHALIKQMSRSSGYSTSSLRERLYINKENETGILIYTSSSDSEGTLGGLVNLGRKEYFRDIILSMIEYSRWCSSDPLCIESKGQGLHSLNLAACHTCLLLPETSCEERNHLLDRASLIGSIERPNIGYFTL